MVTANETTAQPENAELRIYQGPINGAYSGKTTYFTIKPLDILDMIGESPTVKCNYYRVIDDGYHIPFVTHHVGENMIYDLGHHKDLDTTQGRLYRRLLMEANRAYGSEE